jgi:flavodoxin
MRNFPDHPRSVTDAWRRSREQDRLRVRLMKERLMRAGNAVASGRRILVVHYSSGGNTQRVAADLATRLGAESEKIGDTRNRRGLLGYVRATLDSIRERPTQLTNLDKNPADFSLTLIGTPIWAGKITPAVRTYLRMNRGRFNDVAFFTTSGSTAAEKVVPAMERLADRQAVAYAGFNYADLKSESLYEKKLTAFLERLRADRTCEVCGQEPKHAHA